MRLAGIDLAWKSQRNTTAVAFGDLSERCLRLAEIHRALRDLGELVSVIDAEDELYGIAIDAPLVINNQSGQRDCEKLLSQEYGGRCVSCHSSNLVLYKNTSSVELSRYLERHGFKHLQDVAVGKCQIECYPHPAILEMFGLPKRLAYKKGRVSDKKQGQIQLSNHIKTLAQSKVLPLIIGGKNRDCLEEENIRSLEGAGLKINEDVLDSIICLYICALFSKSVVHKTYGCVEDGYIYVPKQRCI